MVLLFLLIMKILPFLHLTYKTLRIIVLLECLWGIIFLLDNNDIRFGTKLCGQIVSIPIGSNYAPFVVFHVFLS